MRMRRQLCVADDIDSVEGQLWRLLVVASVDPRLWAEKRANEGKLVDVKSRQLDGLSDQDAVASESVLKRKTADTKTRRVEQSQGATMLLVALSCYRCLGVDVG